MGDELLDQPIDSEQVVEPAQTEPVPVDNGFVPIDVPAELLTEVPAELLGAVAPVYEAPVVEENPNAWVDPSTIAEEPSLVEEIIDTVVDAYETVVETVSNGVDTVKDFFTGEDQPTA